MIREGGGGGSRRVGMCGERVVMVMVVVCGHCQYGRGVGMSSGWGWMWVFTHLSALAVLLLLVVWTWIWAESCYCVDMGWTYGAEVISVRDMSTYLPVFVLPIYMSRQCLCGCMLHT